MKYHNPENVPEDKIPEGWRLLLSHEIKHSHERIRVWLDGNKFFGEQRRHHHSELEEGWTYIVPIGEPQPVPTDPKGPAGSLKPQLQLIPPVLSEEAAKAHALGAQKYGPWNWRHNRVEIMTYLGAMKRHIDAFIEGQDIDPESGAHHLGHVATGCGIVLDAARHGTLIDNRPPRNEAE